uniref:SH3 and multiple ankyrin repeat domains 2a n=1 Tax=Sinocyclocheilus rhinocerous TaxID=307959 RepID=A0A673HMB6_9TELE
MLCAAEVPGSDAADSKRRSGLNNARHFLHSDCVTEQKTAVLQKQENEGFGFVLRGAKADTPIEEFIPTPAFPALQYLESVDEGGDAWLMGLRTGDFLIEVRALLSVHYGAREGTCSAHLVLSWERHINSWECDIISWPRDINSLLPRTDDELLFCKMASHGYHRQNFEQYDCQTPSAAQQNMCSHNRAHVPENPYSDIVGKPLYIPPKPARRKGILVKQPNVEDSPEKTCSIPIPTIIVKEPSTSSSGKSSRGSSMEIETSASEQPGQLRPDGSHIVSNPFAAAIAGAVRHREKRLEARKNSPAFLSMDLGDEDPFIPTPRLRQSMSIDEGMFASDKSLQKLMAPPASLLEHQQIVSGGNMAGFTIPEPTTEPLTTRTRSFPNTDGPISLDGDFQNQTLGKTCDICPPFALGLALSNRALKEHVQPPLPPPKREPHKANLNQPLFIDTKLRSNIDANFVATASVGQPKDCGGLFRHTRESNHETEKAKERNPSEQSKNSNNTSQQQSSGLLMVHTQDKAKPQVNTQPDRLEQEESPEMVSAPIEYNVKLTAPNSRPPHTRNVVTSATSVEEPVKLPCTIPPPPMTSVDIDEEFEPLPPPLEFANSIDVPEDQVAEILKQKKNNIIGPMPVYHSRAYTTDSVESKCLSGLVNCTTPHTYPPPPPEMFEPVTDSGIEEADSRNNGDPHFEANGTVSTVSSISTLSSEGIDDTCIYYADGQTLLVDRPPVPPKPKTKPTINKSNALYRDPLHDRIHESIESFGQPPPAPPPYLGYGAQSELRKKLAQRGTKLWDHHELPNPLLPNAGPKANVINDLSSKLQQMNKDRFPKQIAGSRSIGSREWTAQASGTKRSNTVPSITPSHLPLQASSPASPPPESGRCSSLPGSAASPTLTDVFSLPSPPILNAEQCYSFSSVSSRSPSPLTLFQASDKPFADKPILLWTKHDVANWLESLNLQEHKKAFLDNEIEGTHLPNLQKEDLVDLGVTRVGHRMNIERGLKLLMDR